MRKLFDIMFDFTSPGAKIKRYAEIAYKVEMIFAGIFAGIVGLATMVSVFSYGMSFGYILIMFLPALIIGAIAGAIIFFGALFGGWLSKIMLYGFGQLIESAEISAMPIDKANVATFNPVMKVEKNTLKEAKESVKKEDNGKEQIEAEKIAIKKAEERAKKEAAEKEAIIKAMEEIEYIDVICNNCGENLSFQKGTKELDCPFCGCKVKINT